MEKNNRSEGGDGRIERKFEKGNWETWNVIRFCWGF